MGRSYGIPTMIEFGVDRWPSTRTIVEEIHDRRDNMQRETKDLIYSSSIWEPIATRDHIDV
jgi:hypothetical protein